MFEPLLAAPADIQFHAIAALLALILGPLALYRRKRDLLHKMIGYIWVLAMAVTIGSSFFIFQIRLIGPFSPIHILSLLAAHGLFQGVRAAIRGNIARHRATMRGLYFWALGLAGLFTLMPGRIMSRVLFADHQEAGFLTLLAIATAGLAGRAIRNRRARPDSENTVV